MRFAMADAGDALDDANFEHTTANGAILRLTKVLELGLQGAFHAEAEHTALSTPEEQVTTCAYQSALRTDSMKAVMLAETSKRMLNFRGSTLASSDAGTAENSCTQIVHHCRSLF